MDRFDSLPHVKPKLNVLPQHGEAPTNDIVGLGRFPPWLHRKLPKGDTLLETKEIVKGNRLHTVCEEAKCPNLFSCWSQKTATFLIMGKECTRSCGFCDIDFTKEPRPLDQDEPEKVANSVVALDLKHVVITQVARDDLSDGGAAHFARVVQEIKRVKGDTTIEVLTSDMQGNEEALEAILEAPIDIFNHNMETVKRLTPKVRHKATYERSLALLKRVKEKKSLFLKSGMMLGLGEEVHEVEETLRDLASVGVDIVTIGQYLQASRRKLLVKAFIHPEKFKMYEEMGLALGIRYMHCGPFVRSSYNADQVFNDVRRHGS